MMGADTTTGARMYLAWITMSMTLANAFASNPNVMMTKSSRRTAPVRNVETIKKLKLLMERKSAKTWYVPKVK